MPAFSKCEFCQKSAAKFDGFCKTSAKFSTLGAKNSAIKFTCKFNHRKFGFIKFNSAKHSKTRQKSAIKFDRRFKFVKFTAKSTHLAKKTALAYMRKKQKTKAIKFKNQCSLFSPAPHIEMMLLPSILCDFA